MGWAIRVSDVSKRFSLERERVTLFRALQRRLMRASPDSAAFYALKDINIEVFRGEKIGVVGDNGSGKTTLLKVIAGLHRPSDGRVRVSGDVCLLAGIGIGMLHELSVEENVFVYGAIYGMSRHQIRKSFQEIIEWAELQDFVRAELRALSSGMRSRLAFSVARHIQTDVLLLDEALSAGDRSFRQKCNDYFEASRQSNRTFLVATHDLDFVQMFCARTLWLHSGQQMAFGETRGVLRQYAQSNLN
ncbi:MAG: ATP-binding cassette domain-containing protein [Anaerolineae bacterium]|jgi:ABC-type polysaccharide/polyol phosphate transport system ATPase subunit